MASHWCQRPGCFALVAAMCLALAGCGEGQPPSAAPDASPAAKPRASVALRVWVVNEPELAAAIGRLEGEWSERFGGTLTAAAKSWEEVAAADALEADVVVFPSRYLGELCAERRLRPVRSHLLKDETFDFDDIFPLIRFRLIVWGGEVMALPLGIHVPAISTMPEDHSATLLLARAAPDAVSADNSSVLFDPKTMTPRITEPPFVAAIRSLSEATAVEAPHVPMLGIGDRLVAVTRTSRNAATAFKLIGWLAGPEISSQLASAAGGTLPVRRSLASSPAWYDADVSASERNNLGNALDSSLSGERCLVVPRIPGIDQYLAALDRAVQDTVENSADPVASLETAAAEWEKITDAHGRNRQRDAYRKHLGISQP